MKARIQQEEYKNQEHYKTAGFTQQWWDRRINWNTSFDLQTWCQWHLFLTPIFVINPLD